MEKKKKRIKTGTPIQDPDKGWYVVNEEGANIFLKEDREGYIATFKKHNKIKVLSTSFDEQARKVLWKETDEKNG